MFEMGLNFMHASFLVENAFFEIDCNTRTHKYHHSCWCTTKTPPLPPTIITMAAVELLHWNVERLVSDPNPWSRTLPNILFYGPTPLSVDLHGVFRVIQTIRPHFREIILITMPSENDDDEDDLHGMHVVTPLQTFLPQARRMVGTHAAIGALLAEQVALMHQNGDPVDASVDPRILCVFETTLSPRQQKLAYIEDFWKKARHYFAAILMHVHPAAALGRVIMQNADYIVVEPQVVDLGRKGMFQLLCEWFSPFHTPEALTQTFRAALSPAHEHRLRIVACQRTRSNQLLDRAFQWVADARLDRPSACACRTTGTLVHVPRCFHALHDHNQLLHLVCASDTFPRRRHIAECLIDSWSLPTDLVGPILMYLEIEITSPPPCVPEQLRRSVRIHRGLPSTAAYATSEAEADSPSDYNTLNKRQKRH